MKQINILMIGLFINWAQAMDIPDIYLDHEIKKEMMQELHNSLQMAQSLPSSINIENNGAHAVFIEMFQLCEKISLSKNPSIEISKEQQDLINIKHTTKELIAYLFSSDEMKLVLQGMYTVKTISDDTWNIFEKRAIQAIEKHLESKTSLRFPELREESRLERKKKFYEANQYLNEKDALYLKGGCLLLFFLKQMRKNCVNNNFSQLNANKNLDS